MAWIRIEVGEGPNPWGRDAKYADRLDDISWDQAFGLYGEFQDRLDRQSFENARAETDEQQRKREEKDGVIRVGGK